MRQRIDNIVFAGGGNRCLWQAGFYLGIAAPLALEPRAVAAASAGAAIACVTLAGRATEALAHFKQATARNRRNAYFRHVFVGKPVFPHYGMYRSALLAFLDEGAMRRLRAGPDIRVPVTRAPRWLGAGAGFALAGLADTLDHLAGPSVHARIAPRLGFRSEVLRVRDCATPAALADLILASSCTPPFTPALSLHGAPALDGGIADNVPVAALADVRGHTLVLLTRRFRRLPSHAARTYVQPSRPIPVSSWDYTDPDGLQAAFDLGRRDAEAFLAAQKSP